MPVILASPEELARMDWREREKAMQRARRSMQALRDAESKLEERLERLWDEESALRQGAPSKPAGPVSRLAGSIRATRAAAG